MAQQIHVELDPALLAPRPKTRRPNGILPDPPGKVHPADETGDFATFEYREDAVAAGRALSDSDRFGWLTHPQFIGAWDIWIVTARRRSSRYADASLRTDGKVR